MHEASLVQGLLDLVTASVDEYNANNPARQAARVNEIVCEYGLLACFEEHALRSCFELFAEGTCAEGARLALEPAPLNCRCNACKAEFTLLNRHFACPECQSPEIRFTGGNGLVLKAINVDAGESKND